MRQLLNINYNNMKLNWSVFVILLLGLSCCIKDDFVADEVEPSIRITNSVISIKNGTDFQFEYMYLNNVGVKEEVSAMWESTDTSALKINETTGLATTHNEGEVTIIVKYDDGTQIYTDSLKLMVGSETVITPAERSGSVATTSTYALTGDFILKQSGDDLILEFSGNYEASTALPGLYVYLSNNPATSSGAYEIGPVEIFSGSHSYEIPDKDILTYNYVLYFCKPFNQKVGHGEIQ